MNNLFLKMIIISSLFAISICGAHAADLEFGAFLQQVNLSAEADFGAFRARLSTDFGVPAPKVEVLLNSLPTPADAYMCLQVSQVTAKPVEVVVNEFNANRGKGWGAIAKNLGIKPGSKEFHALKAGKFEGGQQKGNKEKGHGKKK